MGDTDYAKYRGKCKQFSEFAVFTNPDLKLVRGHYFCPIWGEQEHWWTTYPDGTIFDPTAKQFPSGGIGDYVEFAGAVSCAQCGKEWGEETAYFYGNYAFCPDTKCCGYFIGVY